MPALAIDPAAPAFSRRNAHYLANAAGLAYSDEPAEAARELLGLEAETFRHPGSDTQGFAGRCAEFAVLAFRGSERIDQHPKDWLTNFQFAQAQRESIVGRVHSGFSGTLAAAWDEVEAVLRRALAAMAAVDADEPGLPLYIAGHSLGGALATLAACRLGPGGLPARGDQAAARLNLRDTYTFGAPRVGDPEFCREYRPRTFRVVNNLDLVPLVPLAGADLQALRDHLPDFAPGWIKDLVRDEEGIPPYGHAGTLVHLDAAGREVGAGERSNWLADYSGQFLRSLGRTAEAPVKDHAIRAYISALAP